MANLVTPSIDQFRVTKNMILLGIENFPVLYTVGF
jgi:hypothetical protein